MVEAFAAQPTASVPRATGKWAATKAAYNFWDSERVEPEAIRGAHRDSTVVRLVGQKTILAVQDTTDPRFARRSEAEGSEGSGSVGMKVHSALCVSMEGVPLGVVHQQVWVRGSEELGKAKRRRQLVTKDKESQRWLDTLDGTLGAIPKPIEVITVADREADIYDLFARERRNGAGLLIRATHDRKVSGDGAEATYLWGAIQGVGPAGTISVEIGRRQDTPVRTAILTVRHTRVEIQPPRHHKARAGLKPIPLRVVLAREEEPPSGVEPICWLLLTTLAVENLGHAAQCLR
jgi:hypothetical protein